MFGSLVENQGSQTASILFDVWIAGGEFGFENSVNSFDVWIAGGELGFENRGLSKPQSHSGPILFQFLPCRAGYRLEGQCKVTAASCQDLLPTAQSSRKNSFTSCDLKVSQRHSVMLDKLCDRGKVDTRSPQK